MANTPVTESEVKQFIEDWFAKLDDHVPVEELLPLVADEELVMKMPESSEYRHSGFIKWYNHAINTFFDEVHIIHALRITPSQDSAKVEIVLQWEPVIWNAPAARSKRQGYFAAQTWLLKRSPETKRLFIVNYNVDYFIPMEGSDEL
ncbi:MAG: hypothetical protein OEM01_01525 [Desulfobulbaceae bacterium]|nr:hypothetical protein [Desulfobulbaceae bacterium]